MYEVPDELGLMYSLIYHRQKMYSSVAQHVPLQFHVFNKGEMDHYETAVIAGTHIHFCREFIAGLSYQEVAGVGCHEIMHYMMNHSALAWQWQHDKQVTGKLHDGTSVTYPYYNQVAQFAFDLSINDGLIRSGVTLPPERAHDPSIGGWLDFEGDIYVRVYDANKDKIEQQRGDEEALLALFAALFKLGLMSGMSDVVPMDPNQDPFVHRRNSVLRKVLAEIDPTKMKGFGAGDLEKLIEKIAPMRIDWRELLEPRFKSHLGGPYETWSRINRAAFAQGYVLPGRTMRRAGFVVLVLDTSGSVGRDEQQMFVHGLIDLFKQSMPQRLLVLEIDAMLRRQTEITNIDDLERFTEPMRTGRSGLRGGGGTDMRVGHNFIVDQGLHPEMTLYFTDMGTDFPEDLGNSKEVVWCATTDLSAPEAAGRTIRVEQ